MTEADSAFMKHKSARSQNPIMHLFEAIIALYDAKLSAEPVSFSAAISNTGAWINVASRRSNPSRPRPAVGAMITIVLKMLLRAAS